jgi:C-terminal processing protease CtpA/Prc
MIASSEVIRVRSGTPAAAQGVVVGAIVLGINGEPYVSHLHTANLLKNAPRPIVVRFMFPKS